MVFPQLIRVNSQSARNALSFNLFSHRYASHENSWELVRGKQRPPFEYHSHSPLGEAPKSKAKEAAKAKKGGPSEKHWLELLVEFYDELKAWQSVEIGWKMRFYQPTLPFPWPPNLCNFRCLIISVIIPTLLTPIVHLKVRVIRSSQGNNEHIFSSSRSTSIIISIVSSSSPHFGWLEDWNAATCKLEASPVYAWNTRLELTGTTEIYWVHFEDFFGKFGSAPEAHFEDSKVFLVYSPQTEDDRTVANKCYHMQIIQKESNEQLQLYVSDIHFAVWAPSDGCSLKPLKKRTLQVTTPLLLQREGTFRRGIQRGEMAAKVHGRADTSDVFGVRRLGKQRSETNPVFYCDVLCRENVAHVRKSVCFLYFISFHVGILLRIFYDPTLYKTVELQMFSRCPFLYVIIDNHAVWALSGMEFMNYCWVVGERLSQASIILKRRNQDGQERVSSIFGPYIHTDPAKKLHWPWCFELSPVNDQLSHFFNIPSWWRHLVSRLKCSDMGQMR